VDNRSEIREFLVSRRANISPQQAGLLPHGIRRVPGLRRSEVAALAGASLEYYTRLERGNLAGVSDSVMEALARALQLDDAERTHLADLARNRGPASRRPRRKPHGAAVRPNLQRVAGRLELTFEVLMPAADGDQSLVVCGAEPGSATADGLRLLAGWAATREEQPPDLDTGRT
jgi:transcriptional regulator with XRE-family HTH domain